MDAWVPSVVGCQKVGQYVVWFLSLIFTLLFFILGMVDVANRGWYGMVGAGIVPHHTKGYSKVDHNKWNEHWAYVYDYRLPLGMHEACWYIIYIFISLASLAAFVFILIIKKVDSETPVKPLFGKFGKFHLVPLLCGFSLLCFNTVKNGDYKVMGIFAFIFSIAGLVLIILIWVMDKPQVSDWKAWFCVKLFLGSLAFLHFNNFLECFSLFQAWHCDGNSKCSDKDGEYDDRIIAFQVILCVLAMVGIAVWTLLIQDVVVAFYGLMLFIGVCAFGGDYVPGSKKSDIEITSIIVGLIGIVVVVVCVVIGIIKNKMKMLWG